MRSFEYDFENQLTNVFKPGAWRSGFQYDGLGRRRIRREYTWSQSGWVQTNEVRYVYDGRLVVQERDAFNIANVSYTRGSDLSGTLEGAGGIGGLLARSDNRLLVIGDPGAHAYYFADPMGNITCLVNSSNVIVARYSYDPYGNLIAKSGPLADANLYGFSSKEWDSRLGLIYFTYRYYSADLARWLTRDPIGENGGVNLFSFLHNTAGRQVDPFGLAECGDWGGIWYPELSSARPLARGEVLAAKPPVRIMPNTFLVNPASGAGSPAAAAAGFGALLVEDYTTAGAPILFSIGQWLDSRPVAATPEQMRWDCQWASRRPPPGEYWLTTTRPPSAPPYPPLPPPPPPPNFPHMPWNSGSTVNAPPVILIR